MHVAQHFRRAVAAPAAAGADAELSSQILQRADAVFRALANGTFSHGVA
jgi:hypothetical protein